MLRFALETAVYKTGIQGAVHLMDMKRDGRTLDHQTLEVTGLMAVVRVREGESAVKVIEAYGFNRTTIYK